MDFDRAQVRSVELGRIGEFLYSAACEYTNTDWNSNYSEQLTIMYSQVSRYNNALMNFSKTIGGIHSIFTMIGLSMLFCEIPTQIEVDQLVILRLADVALISLDEIEQKSKQLRGLSNNSNNNSNKHAFNFLDVDLDCAKIWPAKSFTEAKLKANIWMSDVQRALKRRGRNSFLEQLNAYSYAFIGLMNDQAAACIMHAYALQRVLGDRGIEIAVRMIHDPGGCKAFSTVIKALGVNCTDLGSMLVEGQTLQGRGVGDVDMRDECLERVIPERCAKLVVNTFSEAELRSTIRQLLIEELDLPNYRYVPPAEYWDRRWEWCVNGSHSRALERNRPQYTIGVKGQIHRRVAVENWTANPMDDWDSHVYSTSAKKFEHGKTRLLVTIDTASYVAFNHLLRPVEKAWRNKRILLDPGKEGNSGISDRVTALRGGVNVMLDFDSFDTQHTLLAQKVLFDELCDYVKYPVELRERLVNSFDNQICIVGGEILGKLKGVLSSGHRGTSFINSMLNATYIRLAWPDGWNKFDSMHTGDDVVARLRDYGDVQTLLSGIKSRKLRMNPMKQSVGAVSQEFLRMCVTPDDVHGYLCRAISSAISGSWTNSTPLGVSEKLMNAITNSRSLINRSRCPDMYIFSVEGVHQRTKFSRRMVENLLSGVVALDNGPCFTKDGLRREYSLVGGVKKEKLNLLGLASQATGAYLSKIIKPIERAAIMLTGADVKSMMLEASYAKSLTAFGIREPVNNLRLIERPVVQVSGGISLQAVYKMEPVEGLLSSSPIISLLEKMLNTNDLRIILALMQTPAHNDVRTQCFGPSRSGNVIVNPMSYADAAATSKRCGGNLVFSSRPVYM